MFQVVTDFSIRVLHIRSRFIRTLNGSENIIENTLIRAGAIVENCGDVYRGLARLGRAKLGCFRAAIVCVDGLNEAEMAFFRVAKRLCQGVDIRAYGSEARVREAIRLGAMGRFTVDTADELLGNERDEGEDIGSDAVELPADDRSERDVDGEETESAVRVPWGRYEGGPRRVRPGESKIANREDRVEEEASVGDVLGDNGCHMSATIPLERVEPALPDGLPPSRGSDQYGRGSGHDDGSGAVTQHCEPLLTAEELAALMADLGEDVEGMSFERPVESRESEVRR